MSFPIDIPARTKTLAYKFFTNAHLSIPVPPSKELLDSSFETNDPPAGMPSHLCDWWNHPRGTVPALNSENVHACLSHYENALPPGGHPVKQVLRHGDITDAPTFLRLPPLEYIGAPRRRIRHKSSKRDRVVDSVGNVAGDHDNAGTAVSDQDEDGHGSDVNVADENAGVSNMAVDDEDSADIVAFGAQIVISDDEGASCYLFPATFH